MTDAVRVPLTIDSEWRSKTVTTDPPRYTPHLEWAVGFTLTAAEPLRAVVFIEDAAETAWGLVAVEPSATLRVEVKFFPYDWSRSDDVQISFEWQRRLVHDRALKEDPREVVKLVAPTEAETATVLRGVELPSHSLALSLLAVAQRDTENQREGRWRLKPALADAFPAFGDGLASGRQSGVIQK